MAMPQLEVSRRQEIVSKHEETYYKEYRGLAAKRAKRIAEWLREQYTDRFGVTPDQDGLVVDAYANRMSGDDIIAEVTTGRYHSDYRSGDAIFVTYDFSESALESLRDDLKDNSDTIRTRDQLALRIQQRGHVTAEQAREAADWDLAADYIAREDEMRWEDWDPEALRKKGSD